MTTSQDQVARLLALAPYLASRPEVPVDEVAATFGVSRRQVIEDLRVLLFCGLPGGLPGDLIEVDLDVVREEGVINLTNAEFLGRPLRLRADEAWGLVVALQAVAELATGDVRTAAHSLLDKLQAIAGSDATQRARVDLVSGSADVRAALIAAIEAGQRVELTYDGWSRAETTTPTVDPVALTVRDGVVYLQAYSLTRDGWRTYRLERIVEVRPSGEAAVAHGAPPPLESGWFERADQEVTLRLAASAAWVGEYYPSRSVRPRPDGDVEVVLPIGDPRWLTSLLLQLGSLVRAVDPPEAVADALAQAKAALALYDVPERSGR